MIKKIFTLLTILICSLLASAQDDTEIFEKEYKFPLQLNKGKCEVSGAMDFTQAKPANADAVFTNIYTWLVEHIGSDKILKISPQNLIISCKYTFEGKPNTIGKSNVYQVSAAFRIDGKIMYISQKEIQVMPALSIISKKYVPIEKYAELKKPADEALINEFNEINNNLLAEIEEFVANTTPELVQNWDNIVSKRVVEGMTMTECKLALGEPKSVIEGQDETQWIYGLSLIVYFDKGIDVNPKTNAQTKREKKVIRILR